MHAHSCSFTIMTKLTFVGLFVYEPFMPVYFNMHAVKLQLLFDYYDKVDICRAFPKWTFSTSIFLYTCSCFLTFDGKLWFFDTQFFTSASSFMIIEGDNLRELMERLEHVNGFSPRHVVLEFFAVVVRCRINIILQVSFYAYYFMLWSHQGSFSNVM